MRKSRFTEKQMVAILREADRTTVPVAPHIIDKGLPTTGLLAQVLVAKYLDHLPLYRQEASCSGSARSAHARHCACFVGLGRGARHRRRQMGILGCNGRSSGTSTPTRRLLPASNAWRTAESNTPRPSR
jgi:hypothetical protein